MTPSLALNDILLWSLQIALLVAIAAILPPVLRLKMPKSRLAFLQLVLVACLLLPFVRVWKHEPDTGAVTASSAIVSIAADQTAKPHSPIQAASLLLCLAAAGIVVRIGFLFAGFWRLRRYRLQSQPLSPASAWGVEADLRVSEEIASPVTFGFRKPVVLLPTRFSTLDESMRDAILCHEILHVRRHDWLFTVAEECVRALLWFHPAIWWLLREIQLVREQAVDREVVEMTRSRDGYIDALLVIAGARPQIDLAPAPLFLRKRHLKQRVASILKEVRMSKAKSISALAASLTVLAASCWFVTGVLPLKAAPQVAPDSPRVSIETDGAQLMHWSVNDPDEAVAKGVQGTVVVQVKLDATGNVTDASIVSGPDELRKAVLQSVLNWHFTKDAAFGTRQVSITFNAPKAAGATAQTTIRPGALPVHLPQNDEAVKSVTITGLSETAAQQLRSQLPVHEGDIVNAATMGKVTETVHAFDEHLRVSLTGDGALYIALPASTGAFNVSPPPPPPPPPTAQTPPDSIHIAGEIQQANLISRPVPVYPPLAKAAHVQGTVRFQATIGKEGTIQNLQLLSGPPLLVQAAMQAVQQWVYRPTMLNGSPVAVITDIEVNFTLAE